MPQAGTITAEQDRGLSRGSAGARDDISVGTDLARPLGDLIERCAKALSALSGPFGGRQDIHALRSSLAEICALTVPSPRVLNAINDVVDAGDQLGEIAVGTSCLLSGRDLRAERLLAAQTSLRQLAQSLSGAMPSHIATSLGRGW